MVAIRGTMPVEDFHQPPDCGLRIADCGLRAPPRFMVPMRGETPRRLPMNLAIRTWRSPGLSDLRFSMYDLRAFDGGIAALRDSHARRSARRGARKSYIVNRTWLRDRRRSGSWPQLTSRFWRCSLPRNRLVTGILSLVTGDLQKLTHSVTLLAAIILTTGVTLAGDTA